MSFKIVEFDKNKHKTGLMRLWRENLSLYDERRFDWLYNKNPAGHSVTFIAINSPTSEIVGCASIMPREIIIDGKKEKIGIAIDFAIDKKYRVFGPAIPLQKAIVNYINEDELLFNFGYPNRAGEGIFPKIGYKKLGYAQSWSKLLRVNKRVEKKIKIKIIVSLISKVINMILTISDKIKSAFLGNEFFLREIKNISNEFDEFWQEMIRNGKIITGIRNKKYLNWRMSQPDKKNILMGFYNKTNKKLLGYISYTEKQETIFIEDMYTFHDEKILSALLFDFAIKMRKKNKDTIYITYFGNNFVSKSLKKANFILRSGKRSCIIYLPEKRIEQSKKNILEKNNWYLLDGEMDL